MTNTDEDTPKDTTGQSKPADAARAALLRAADDLLEGRIPGPLTGIRLVEAAGVKRHRLTHDNPDINADFQQRARGINQHKPEIARLRAARDAQHARATRLAAENATLTIRLTAYAAAILALTEERDKLRANRAALSNVTSIPLKP